MTPPFIAFKNSGVNPWMFNCLSGSSLSAVLASFDLASGKKTVGGLSASVLLSSWSASPGFAASSAAASLKKDYLKVLKILSEFV